MGHGKCLYVNFDEYLYIFTPDTSLISFAEICHKLSRDGQLGWEAKYREEMSTVINTGKKLRERGENHT